MPATRKTGRRKTASKPGAAKKAVGKPARARKPRVPSTPSVNPGAALGPVVAPGSPPTFRARVRMYRQGLGDCFLVTFPRQGREPFQMLIDCGALGRTRPFMTGVVEHIRDTVLLDTDAHKARLDVVVATHEHKDHLSGFNQARPVFNNDFDFGAVWLGWTENLTKPEIRKIKEARRRAITTLGTALASQLATVAPTTAGVAHVLGFSDDEDDTGAGKISEALEYLKLRGKDAGDLRYLEPGTGPFAVEGLTGVRVYVLGPPLDPILLKSSEVTERMKRDRVVYHLSRSGLAGVDALSAAVSRLTGTDEDRYHPFAPEHRITPSVPDPYNPGASKPSPYFREMQPFIASTYDDPAQAWRRIDDDWLSAFGQVALDLDSDTNNTSLVLAFEFEKTGEVLLFVGDAQVGNWQSWATLTFDVPGRPKPMPAHDLLDRTVFYKVGHHCSHNGTLRAGGLELMSREDLVAFIPVDRATAKSQGKKGWDMPAGPLFTALQQKAGRRVVLSDVTASLTPEAARAGVVATDGFIDFFLT
jgi:hypothetical protein